jgi:hypothetical protein
MFLTAIRMSYYQKRIGEQVRNDGKYNKIPPSPDFIQGLRLTGMPTMKSAPGAAYDRSAEAHIYTNSRSISQANITGLPVGYSPGVSGVL